MPLFCGNLFYKQFFSVLLKSHFAPCYWKSIFTYLKILKWIVFFFFYLIRYSSITYLKAIDCLLFLYFMLKMRGKIYLAYLTRIDEATFCIFTAYLKNILFFQKIIILVKSNWNELHWTLKYVHNNCDIVITVTSL